MSEPALPPVSEYRWLGMVANQDAHLRPGEVLLAENYYLDEGVWRPRPGVQRLGIAALADAPVQGLVSWETLSGYRFLTGFCGGGMFEYDWDTSTWTEVEIPALAGIVIDPEEMLDACVSRGRLIVTDGVNRPWMLSVAPGGARTYETLDAAPIARGCTVYYDKVFFVEIPGQESSFEWSDEGNPAAGYLADDQSWEFAQTDQGPIRALAPLNNVLVVFKDDSATFISGAVDDDFQTAAVREGVSETEGAVSRKAVLVVDGDVYLLSASGPRRVLSGERMTALDERVDEGGVTVKRVRDLWSGVNKAAWGRCIGIHDSSPARNHVWWFFPEGTSEEMSRALVYHVNEDAWSTFTFSFAVTSACDVEDPSGNEYLVLGDSDGNTYLYGVEEIWSDAGDAVHRTVRSRLYGRSTPDVVNRMQEVRLTLNLHTDLRAEMLYNRSGELGGAKAFGLAGTRGRRNYRRGFNATGRELGWEFRAWSVGEAASILSCLSFFSVVGTESAWGR